MPYLNGKEIILYARSIAPSLGKKENYIVKFISNNYQEIPNLSISEIAKKLQVSEASITKACKKLKCNGFFELKHFLEDYISNPTTTSIKEDDAQEIYSEQDSCSSILEKVFINSMIAIQDTYSGMNATNFEAAVDLLDTVSKATKLTLIGCGGSGILCQDFQHKLLKIGIISTMFQDTNMQFMSASLSDKNDIVLGISHSGTTKSVLEVMKLAKNHGAKTICITNHAISPITEIADISLHSSAQNSPLTGENASARIAQLNILDALYTVLALRRNNTSYRNLEKTKKSVQSR